jgi:hypothetical protein
MIKDLSPIETYIVVVTHIGLVFAVLYPWDYRRSPWRTSESGPSLMFMACAWAALFVISIVRFWWPFPGSEYLYAAMLTAVVAGIIQKRHVMRRLQRSAGDRVRGDF